MLTLATTISLLVATVTAQTFEDYCNNGLADNITDGVYSYVYKQSCYHFCPAKALTMQEAINVGNN